MTDTFSLEPLSLDPGLLSDSISFTPRVEKALSITPEAQQQALANNALATANAMLGTNYADTWWEDVGVGLMGEIVSGNMESDDIGDLQMRRISELVTRLITSDEEDLRDIGSAAWHKIGDDRMREHMEYIDPHILQLMPEEKEPSWWRSALGGLFNSTVAVLESGWQYVAAPVIGTASAHLRGEDVGLWASRNELDRDGDGRVAGFEALMGRNSDGWMEQGLEIAFEIAFDPVTYLSFGVGATGRQALKGVGRGARAAGKGSEIERIGAALGKSGLKGLDVGDLDDVARWVSKDKAFEINETVRKAQEFAPRVVGEAGDDVIARIGSEVNAIVDMAPDYYRESFRRALGEVGEGIAPEALGQVAIHAQRQLRALERVRQGPKFLGRSLPWSPTLTPSGVTPGLFTPNVTKILGTKQSTVRRIATKPFTSLRPRAGITKAYGLGVAEDQHNFLQWARGSREMRTAYPQTTGEGARKFIREQYGRATTNFRRNDGEYLTRVTFDDLTQDAGLVELGFPKQGSAAWTQADEVAQGEWLTQADEWVQNQAAERFAMKPSYESEMGFVTSAGNPDDMGRFIPIEEYKKLAPFSEGRPVGEFREIASRKLDDGSVLRWAADKKLYDDIDNSMIHLISTTGVGSTASVVNSGLGTFRFLNRLWAAGALSLIRGPSYLTTNVIGGTTAAITGGVNPVLAARVAPQAIKLNRLQSQAHRVMANTRRVRQLADERFGEKSIADLFGKGKRAYTDAADAHAWVDRRVVGPGATDEALANGLTQKEAKLFHEHLDAYGLSGAADETQAYTGALLHLGASPGEISTLYGLNQYGIISGGRASDLLYEGLQVREIPPGTDRETQAFLEKLNKRNATQRKVIDRMNLGLNHISVFAENHLRINTFLATQAQGGTWQDAANMVFKTQFNYADLTRAEHVIKENFSRFYTYPRKLLGLMGETMMTHPSRLTATTRVIGDSFRYILDIAPTGDGGFVDFMLPNWAENEPGTFTVDGMAGRLRLPAFEYLELVGTVARIPEIFLGEDLFSDESMPRTHVAQEAARGLTGLMSGFMPEVVKTALEVGTGRDSFSGADITQEEGLDRAMRWMGVILPGHVSGATMGMDTADMWSEGEPARRDAIVRIASALSGVWVRGAKGLDESAIRELYLALDQSIDDAQAEGLDVATFGELQDAGVIHPNQAYKLQRGYGVQVDRDDPEYDPDTPLHIQRRPMRVEEMWDRLPSSLADAYGVTQTVRRKDYNTFSEYANAAATKQIVGSLDYETGVGSTFADWVARKAVGGDRDIQELIGITPEQVARRASVEISNEQKLAEAERTFAAYGVGVEGMRTVRPFLSDTLYEVERLQAQGLTQAEIQVELINKVPKDIAARFDPRIAGTVKVQGLPYTDDELLRFRDRQQGVADLISYLWPIDPRTASMISTLSLMTAGETSALGIGLPKITPPTFKIEGTTPIRAAQRLEAVGGL